MNVHVSDQMEHPARARVALYDLSADDEQETRIISLAYLPHVGEELELERVYFVQGIVWHAGTRSDGVVCTLRLSPLI